MKREGTGIDLLFERLLASGRKVLTFSEGTDSVHVTVPRRAVQPGVIKLLVEADQRYHLTQRERITFALVAQTEGVSAAKLAEELELSDAAALRPWHGQLPALGLVEQSCRTNATRYFVPPALLLEAGLDALTTLTRVQPHRLRALILEDPERFPDSAKGDIRRRVGREIPERTFRAHLKSLSKQTRLRRLEKRAHAPIASRALLAMEGTMANRQQPRTSQLVKLRQVLLWPAWAAWPETVARRESVAGAGLPSQNRAHVPRP